MAEGAEAVSAEVGVEVEAALHAVSACPSREYQSKGRSLLFNLQKNSDLRKAVLDRDFPADKLVTASSKDLAPAALKMRRKQSAERFIATRQLSSDEKVVGWNAGTSGKLERSHKYEDGEAQGKKEDGRGPLSLKASQGKLARVKLKRMLAESEE